MTLSTDDRIKIYLNQLGYNVRALEQDPNQDFLYKLIESHKWYKESVDRMLAANTGFERRFGWLPDGVQRWLQGL